MLLFLVLVVAFCGNTTAECSLRAEKDSRVWRSTAKELLFDPLETWVAQTLLAAVGGDGVCRDATAAAAAAVVAGSGRSRRCR